MGNGGSQGKKRGCCGAAAARKGTRLEGTTADGEAQSWTEQDRKKVKLNGQLH